ncbi:MAG: VTT domain-containing protein [Dehalococcoidia bacterium]|nr:VTT domain-containing protein [Dehalococcoidia bacterium]
MSLTKSERWLRIIKLAGVLVFLILASFILSYFFQKLIDAVNLPIDNYAFLAYFIVFAVTLIANLTVIAPVPVAIPVCLAVAQCWNPALTAFAAALGGTIGEISGYFAGYAGRKIAFSDDFISMNRIEQWIHRWGAWAIAFLAFQPIIPFDIGGMAAGAAHMPMSKFLPALFAGKYPKYLFIVYTGVGLINIFPKLWGD